MSMTKYSDSMRSSVYTFVAYLFTDAFILIKILMIKSNFCKDFI